MFETLYDEKFRFDWNNMKVLGKVGDKYTELDTKCFDKFILECSYINWVEKVDELAALYSMSIGNSYKDCPVKINQDNLDPLFRTKETRIELNLYLFVGILNGYIKWEWEQHYFHKLNNIILYKKWFTKGGKIC